MVFSELAAGTPFYFGKVMKHRYFSGQGYRDVEEPIKWRKTAENGLSVNETSVISMSFDYNRPSTGVNRYERQHGTRLFSLSSLCKFLNCRDRSWAEVDQGDVAPQNSDTMGFLSYFSPDEMDFLQMHTVTQVTPPGMTKKYGTSVSKEVLVGIPSLAQINRTNGTFGFIEDTGENRYRTGWLLDSDTMSCYLSYGYSHKAGGENSVNIIATIRIKDNAPVDTTEDGAYIIRIPEEDFNGDLNAFLGLAA